MEGESKEGIMDVRTYNFGWQVEEKRYPLVKEYNHKHLPLLFKPNLAKACKLFRAR